MVSTLLGVLQGRSGLRFAFEARNRLRIACDFRRGEFQSHEAVQLGVFGLVCHTHAAAQFLEDAIVGNLLDGITSPSVGL
jgi:hypothetical protein